MENITCSIEGSVLRASLMGHIDTLNAPVIEKKLQEILKSDAVSSAVIDCRDLSYISSAGLRVLLRLKKDLPDLSLIEVTPEVYEIFEMTGFTEMISISKAYRTLSVENCKVIGQGANGKVYRIDAETIVKVYHDPESLPLIQRERELARSAFILGIPTAISYDVVRIEGGGYGSVFELLNAQSLAEILSADPDSLNDVTEKSVNLLKLIHSTSAGDFHLPDMKKTALDWALFLKDYLPASCGDKLASLIQTIPDSDHLLHGDYHLKNILLQNNECLLIDMDTLCHGHPVFELASMYNAYQGFSELNHPNIESFLGITYETAGKLWDQTIRLYADHPAEEKIQLLKDQARLLGQVRLMRRAIRRGSLTTEEGRRGIENSKKHILELTAAFTTLGF